MDMGRKLGRGRCPLFWEGDLGHHLTQCRPGGGLTQHKWHIEASSRLATIEMGRKLGVGLCPFGEGELGPRLTQCGQGRGLPHAKFRVDPSYRLATVHERHRQTGQTGQDRTTDR